MTTLSQALSPLHRGYLRRLDEMAGRIGDGAVLREPTTRDESRNLVLHPSGFVLRFDVADSRTGETFEVHGARPDEPAGAEVRVGAISFALEPGNWEELTLRCVFDGAPAEEDAKALAELLHGWAVLAAHGGFAPTQEAGRGPWTGRLHSAAVRLEGEEMVADLDLGTCPPAAFDALGEALSAFASERPALSRVVIGAAQREDS
ncbi:MAG TPA: hypothetical protein VE964_02360 [Myxococcales bacterium]|nr:hypothetical protein [Myxococcales bacterium]